MCIYIYRYVYRYVGASEVSYRRHKNSTYSLRLKLQEERRREREARRRGIPEFSEWGWICAGGGCASLENLRRTLWKNVSGIANFALLRLIWFFIIHENDAGLGFYWCACNHQGFRCTVRFEKYNISRCIWNYVVKITKMYKLNRT